MKTWPRLFLSLLFTSLYALVATAGQDKAPIKMGFYLPSVRDSNLADIKISLQSWAEELGKPYGYKVLVTTYDDVATLKGAFNRNELDFVNASGMELAEMFSTDELKEGYAPRKQGTGDGLALVVAKDSGIRAYPDLRGKRVSRLAWDRLSEVFLETQCIKSAGRACREFLTLADEKRDIQSVYGVFFGKTDAALVSLATLRTAVELNPQIAEKMTVILEWKTRAMVFGMMTRNADPALRNMILKSAEDALKAPRGRQILEVFRTDNIEAVDGNALKPYWALLQEYNELRLSPKPKKK